MAVTKIDDPPHEVAATRIGAGLYVVELIGDHGFHSSPEIAATLKTLVHRDACLVLDLSRATFVDSSVIRQIVSANTTAVGIGCGFRVQVRAQSSVERVFRVTSLDQVIPTYLSRREALAAP